MELFIDNAATYIHAYSERSFLSHFGVTPAVAATLWGLLEAHNSTMGRKPKHLLWSLHFFEGLPLERCGCSLLSCLWHNLAQMGLDWDNGLI
jgi:hypothetical protein